MTPGVCALLAWALLPCGSHARSQGFDARDKGQGKPAPVTLNNDHRMGSFPVRGETLVMAPSVLALTITRVVNPDKTAFGIFVYLSYRSGAREKHRRQPEKILIGNFSLYPPDRPAGFLLRASTAFSKLAAVSAASKPSEVRLLVEMKRMRETKPWAPVEVTVAPPEWRSEDRK